MILVKNVDFIKYFNKIKMKCCKTTTLGNFHICTAVLFFFNLEEKWD